MSLRYQLVMLINQFSLGEILRELVYLANTYAEEQVTSHRQDQYIAIARDLDMAASEVEIIELATKQTEEN